MKTLFFHLALGLFLANTCFGQSPEYKITRDGQNSFYYAKWRYYGFYDIVRQVGAGVIYSPHPNFELNASLGYIDPTGCHMPLAAAEDYFDYRGAALNLSATFFGKRNEGFYFGVHCSYSAYGYTNQWADPGGAYNTGASYGEEKAPYYEYRDRQMTSFAAGPTIGRWFRGQNASFNGFLKVGIENAAGTINVKLVQDNTGGYYPGIPKAPYSYQTQVSSPYVMFGISAGLAPHSTPAYMFRYYKELFRFRTNPLIQQAMKMERKGTLTFVQVHYIRAIAHETYAEMARYYMEAIFDDTQMQKILDDGVKQMEDILAAGTPSKK